MKNLIPMRLIDVFPNAFTTGGIFGNMTEPPWGDTFNGNELDLQFFTSYGQRYVSPLITYFLNDSGIVSDDNAKKLADLILNRYKVPWSRKNELLKLSYDPIQNYDMTETSSDTAKDSHIETESTDINRTEDSTIKNTVNSTSTQSETGKDDTSTSGTRNTDTSVYGFNSQSAVPRDEVIETTSGTDSVTRTADTDIVNDTTNDGTEKVTVGETGNKNHNLTIDRTGNHTLNRSGNIGVTTSQQMIQSEIDLWDWDFVKSIFEDVKEIISLKIY